ncbi:MAG: phage major capsid protein, partial [Vicinamibacterales bacterium]
VTMQHPIVHIAARVDSDHTTSVAAGVVMTRHVETESVDPARMQLDGIRLEAQELLGVSFATEKLVRDSAQTFVDLLERSYRDATDDTLLEERVRGRGVGEFLGVLHAPCTIIVEPESGQAAGTVVAENIVKMRQRCWNYGAAIWFLNIDHFSAIASAAIPAGVGGAPVRIWEPGNPEDGSPDRILGRPAFFHEVASAAGDVGDVILGNWGEYLDAEYIPLHGVSSMHVRFRAFEQAFRFYTRNDGQPWWRTVLQPRRSLSTLSPFLTLAAR